MTVPIPVVVPYERRSSPVSITAIFDLDDYDNGTDKDTSVLFDGDEERGLDEVDLEMGEKRKDPDTDDESSSSSSSDHSDSSYYINEGSRSSTKMKSVSFAPSPTATYSYHKRNSRSNKQSTSPKNDNRWSSCIANFKSNDFSATTTTTSSLISSSSRYIEEREEQHQIQQEPQLEYFYYIPSRFELLMDTCKSELWYTSREYKLMKDSTEQVVSLLSSGVLQAAQAAQSYLKKREQQLQQQLQQQQKQQQIDLTKQQDDNSSRNNDELGSSSSSSSCSSNILNMICIQGLEGSYGPEKEERSMLRRKGVQTVLAEQYMQTQDGFQCDELLAGMYKDFAIKAQKAAAQRAADLVVDLNNGH